MTPLNCSCCICRQPMDGMVSYGRDGCCCSRPCYTEFTWRRTLAIMGKAYYPDPRVEVTK